MTVTETGGGVSSGAGGFSAFDPGNVEYPNQMGGREPPPPNYSAFNPGNVTYLNPIASSRGYSAFDPGNVLVECPFENHFVTNPDPANRKEKPIDEDLNPSTPYVEGGAPHWHAQLGVSMQIDQRMPTQTPQM